VDAGILGNSPLAAKADWAAKVIPTKTKQQLNALRTALAFMFVQFIPGFVADQAAAWWRLE
jgi:hypothetical protein